jgi:Na+-transporting NADH:ubiquinone oxidoreductase subunit NqrB
MKDRRIVALRRFAISITVLNLLGHTVLGFEQAYVTPIVAVLTAYILELGLETLDARARGRTPKYAGDARRVVEFLLPAHITGLACSMLLYAGNRIWPTVFAVTVAIASKYLVRVAGRHVLNPSNFGIAVTLVLLPSVGIAPPYEFTEWVGGPLDWIIPVAILAAGTMLNAKLTRKMPLIAGWAAGFATVAVLRTAIEGTSTVSALLVMTGTAFILYTNYMITDPGTTPVKPWRQAAFGVSTAVVYGLLVFCHIAFGLFFALVIVCALRGVGVAIAARRVQASPVAAPAQPVPALVR